MASTQSMILTGNTYAVRAEIARIEGARWDAGRKAWIIERKSMRQWSDAQAAAHGLRRRAGISIATE